ncbi:hypothetical protein [Cetobacterium sp.]|uniref:hypothetical protein n=1 Tax=Cetobacterium sp. TaxID=2071632 RepID=UPI003F3221B5
MIIFLLGILSIKINEKKIDKLFFICGSIFFLITIIMNSFEVLNDKALYRVYKIGKTFYAGEKRESLGFGHPNAVSLYYLGILFPYLKYRYNFFNKIDFFIIGISSYLLYIKTLSRLGLVSSIISLLLVILLKQKFLNKFKFKFTKNWFIFGIVITFLLSLFSKTKLDYILSFRLSYWKFYFKKITFLGNQSFTEIFEKNRNFILDNTYIYALYVYGVFGTLILMYIFYRCSKNFLRKRRLLILILVLFFTSFSESVLVNRISCCYLLVLMIREELKTNKRVSQIYLEKIKISLS